MDGVLVVDKPAGISSHDVVMQARRRFNTREVGHAGTLDPLATGVLVLLFGQATKLSSYLTLARKRYRTRVTFGRATDTLDAAGRTVLEQPLDRAFAARLSTLWDSCLEQERARTKQVPPAYSAIQVQGERAYLRARQGQTVELEPRAVQVFELSSLALCPEHAELELCVSKGYYVRALARDLGHALNIPAHVTALRRLSSGCFELAEAVDWPMNAQASLISLDVAARRALPSVQLTAGGAEKARHGRALSATDLEAPPEVIPGFNSELPSAWFFGETELIALGKAVAPGEYRVIRGFSPA